MSSDEKEKDKPKPKPRIPVPKKVLSVTEKKAIDITKKQERQEKKK